jgi:mRNA interferase YafQ
MRTIERSTAFKRDYKREARGKHWATLDSGLVPVLEALAEDTPMEVRHRDHELSGAGAAIAGATSSLICC